MFPAVLDIPLYNRGQGNISNRGLIGFSIFLAHMHLKKQRNPKICPPLKKKMKKNFSLGGKPGISHVFLMYRHYPLSKPPFLSHFFVMYLSKEMVRCTTDTLSVLTIFCIYVLDLIPIICYKTRSP